MEQDIKPLSTTDGPLSGVFEHALDPKKRITIPSVWREVMGAPTHVHVMPDPCEACLTMLPPAVVQPRLQELRARALFDEGQTESLADFFEGAEFLALDVQGRIRIGDDLLAFAKIDGHVQWLGLGVRVQIWSAKLRPRRKGVDQEKLLAAAQALGFR